MHSKSNKISSFVKKNRTKIAMTAISIVLIAAGLFVTVYATDTVKIIHNGKEHEISTMRKDTDEIIHHFPKGQVLMACPIGSF